MRSEGRLMSDNRYPEEVLDPEYDDGTMPANVSELTDIVVGHRIVNVERIGDSNWSRSGTTLITLDNGKVVRLRDTEDCCAGTEVDAFLLHPELIDHLIIGVGTTDEYSTWHIYADLGDVLELTVGWSCGNPFYYGYGFDIDVVEIGVEDE